MNTILIIAIVVIIFLLFIRCKITCSQVSEFEDQNKGLAGTDNQCCCIQWNAYTSMLPASTCAKNYGVCEPLSLCATPQNPCDLIGNIQLPTEAKWTPEMLKEAKDSCNLYNSKCGQQSTFWMAVPIINGTNTREKVTEFNNAAMSVLHGTKECASQFHMH